MCKIIPGITEQIYINSKINIFSFTLDLLRNRISIPAPAFVQRPAIKAPKLSVPWRYNCVKRTDDAQFGIKPISAEINGCSAESESKRCESFSKPIKLTVRSMIQVNKRRKAKTFTVWTSAGRKTPLFSSQPQWSCSHKSCEWWWWGLWSFFSTRWIL